MKPKTHRMGIIIPILLLIVLTTIVYINALRSDFVYDDKAIVYDNPAIKTLNNIPSLFISNYWGSLGKHGLYRPIVMASYALDYRIWKRNPFGFHLTNMMIHIMNVILIYFITMGLVDDKKVCFFTALFFAVHPVHVEAVSGIVGRAELLSAFFIFLSWRFLIKEDQPSNFKIGIWYFMSVLFYTLALFSKENAVIFPFLLGIYYICFKKEQRRKFRKILPFLYVSFVYFFIRFMVLGGLGISKEGQFFSGTNLFQRIPIITKIITKYIGMLFFPVDLLPVYSHLFNVQSDAVYNISFFVKISVIVLILVYSTAHILNYRGKAIVSFCILWFFISLFPVSNIIPIGTPMADRLLYLPSFGFCLCIPILFYYLKDRFIILLMVIFVLFAHLTVKQNRRWKDNFSLWEYTVKRAPMSSTAHNNLGIELLERGFVHKAITEFTRAISIDQNDYKSYLNLGVAYQKIGRFKDTLEVYNRALRINPDSGTIYLNIGNFYFRDGNYEKAEYNYKKGLEKDLKNASLHNNLGVIYMNKGLYLKAKEEFEKAISLDPSHENAKKNLMKIM